MNDNMVCIKCFDPINPTGFNITVVIRTMPGAETSENGLHTYYMCSSTCFSRWSEDYTQFMEKFPVWRPK